MSLHDILTQPSAALFVTIGSYLLAQWFQKKMGNHDLLSPVVVAILLVVTYIAAFGLSYEQYLEDVHVLYGLLGTATVALAVPLYKQLSLIKQSLFGIGAAVLVCSLVAAGVAYYIAHTMGASEELQLAIIPKSTTTAICIGIAEKIGAKPSLAVFFLFTTGIVGSLIAVPLLKLVRITDDRAIGLALGVTSHGLGLARAFQHSNRAGAFAALGLSLMGMVSGVVLPILVFWLVG